MKQAISALSNSGKYSATSFNLAFYLSTLLKKEAESENIDREKESKVNVAPYLEHQLEISAPTSAGAEGKKQNAVSQRQAAAAVAGDRSRRLLDDEGLGGNVADRLPTRTATRRRSASAADRRDRATQTPATATTDTITDPPRRRRPSRTQSVRKCSKRC